MMFTEPMRILNVTAFVSPTLQVEGTLVLEGAEGEPVVITTDGPESDEELRSLALNGTLGDPGLNKWVVRFSFVNCLPQPPNTGLQNLPRLLRGCR